MVIKFKNRVLEICAFEKAPYKRNKKIDIVKTVNINDEGFIVYDYHIKFFKLYIGFVYLDNISEFQSCDNKIKYTIINRNASLAANKYIKELENSDLELYNAIKDISVDFYISQKFIEMLRTMYKKGYYENIK